MKTESFAFEGMKVQYLRAGQGLPLLLLHGSGPGASSLGNWKAVLGPLSEQYEVYAMDLIGFGGSQRKPAPPFFDYALWLRQALVRAIAGLVHDTRGIGEAYYQQREAVIYAEGYADYFDAMFGGDKQQYIEAAVLADALLARVTQPVLLLHGRNDRGFPAAGSLEIGARLPHADVMLLDACSHSVAVERAPTFMALATDFFSRHLT